MTNKSNEDENNQLPKINLEEAFINKYGEEEGRRQFQKVKGNNEIPPINLDKLIEQKKQRMQELGEGAVDSEQVSASVDKVLEEHRKKIPGHSDENSTEPVELPVIDLDKLIKEKEERTQELQDQPENCTLPKINLEEAFINKYGEEEGRKEYQAMLQEKRPKEVQTDIQETPEIDLLQVMKDTYGDGKPRPLTFERLCNLIIAHNESETAPEEEPKPKYDEALAAEKPWEDVWDSLDKRFKPNPFSLTGKRFNDAKRYFERGPDRFNFKKGRQVLHEAAKLMLTNAARDNYLECEEFQEYFGKVLQSLGTYCVLPEAMTIYVNAKGIELPDFEESKKKELDGIVDSYSWHYAGRTNDRMQELGNRLMAVCDNIQGENAYYQNAVRMSLGMLVEGMENDQLDRLEESVTRLEDYIPGWEKHFSFENWDGYSPPEMRQIALSEEVEQELGYIIRQNFLDDMEYAGRAEFRPYDDSVKTVRTSNRVKLVKDNTVFCIVDFEGIAEPSVKSKSDFWEFQQKLSDKLRKVDEELAPIKEYLPWIRSAGTMPMGGGKAIAGYYVVDVKGE